MKKKRRPSKRQSAVRKAQVRSRRFQTDDRDVSGVNQATKAFERALHVGRQCPSDFAAQASLVNASLEAAEYKVCRSTARQLIEQWPNRFDGRFIASKALETMGDLPGAAECISVATTAKDSPAEIRIQYAHLMERMHQIDAAAAIVSEMPRAMASTGEVRLIHAEVMIRQRQFDDSVDLLLPIVDDPSMDGEHRIRAGYLLARCYDRLGEFRRAFDVLKQTKSMQSTERLSVVNAARRSIVQHLELAHKLEAQHIGPVSPTEDQPQLHLLGGFPRSGTTLLESALAQHPQLKTLEETPIFTQSILHPLSQRYGSLGGPIKMLESLTDGDLRNVRQTYLRRAKEFLEQDSIDVAVLDKNPILTPAAPFFFRVFPASRAIICCRDPRDVLLSNFFLYPGSLNSFNAQHMNLNDLAKWIQVHWNCAIRLRSVQPERVWFVRYEDTIRSFETSLRTALDFLGLPWTDEVLEYRERAAQRPARSPSYAEVVQPLYSHAIGRWENYADLLESAIPHFSSAVNAWESKGPNSLD